MKNNRYLIVLMLVLMFSVTVFGQSSDYRYDITLTQAGTLKSQLYDLDADHIEGLTLHGEINGSDLAFLSAASGIVANLSFLDLTDVSLVNDGVYYATRIVAPEAGMGTTYTYKYYVSDTNYDEQTPGSPGKINFNLYRNDLSCAFMGNETLVEVRLPKSIEAVGEYIFSECAALKTVMIPDGAKRLGQWSLSICPALESIQLPSSITEIGDYALYYSKELTNSMNLSSVRRIGEGAFEESSVPAISLSENLKDIGRFAFRYSQLHSISIPSSIDSIPEGAFMASALTECSLGDKVRFIGTAAFQNCGRLTDISIPATLEEIGESAFMECPFLNTIAPENGILYLGSVAYQCVSPEATSIAIKAGTVSLAANLFYPGFSVTDISLPESLKYIGDQCFRTTKLKKISLPATLKRIGAWAFSEVTTISTIAIPENVEFIGDRAFADCKALWRIDYNATNAQCDEYWLSNSDAIERVNLGDKVKRIPPSLYSAREFVTELILPSSVEYISAKAFQDCKNLISIKLPDNIKDIEDCAFNGCGALKEIHWPLYLKRIGFEAFRECHGLEVISLPESVIEIGQYAFFSCDGVTTLYIPSTLHSVGYGAFSLGKSQGVLLTITSTASTPPSLYSYWTNNVNIEKIKVPAESLDAYKSAEGWSDVADRIIPIQEIESSSKGFTSNFENNINEYTNLSDNVIDNIYFTLSKEDEFDPTDGSIILSSSMSDSEMDAIGGMAPGKTDIANRFNGLILMADAGDGNIAIDCQTIGNKKICVKIGEEIPVAYTQNNKGQITVKYNVTEPTYIYIYGSNNTPAANSIQSMRSNVSSTENCIKLYSVSINPLASGVDNIDADGKNQAKIIGYYTIDGKVIDSPSAPGIYVVHRADGSSSKIIIQ